jgi:precorrin-2 methylase
VSAGSLTIVGTGISIGGHLTPEARAAFAHADVAWYLVGDPVATAVLEEINPRARSLHTFYEAGTDRRRAYEAMVDELLEPVRAGKTVCGAFYGHPGVFVYPSLHAVRRAREEGFEARMLPGISSLDCLWADVGIDPAAAGCQIYHATDFLLEARKPDTAATLVLLQINVIGQAGHCEEPDWSRLPILVDYLLTHYPAEHEVIGYEASPFPLQPPIVERVPLGELAGARLTPGMTLVVPPATAGIAHPEMARRLELDASA